MSPPAFLPGRPSIAKARRAAPFASRGEPVLSRMAEEALFEHAEVLLEGATQNVAGSESFFGSVMMAVHFDLLGSSVRGLETDEAREEFTRCVEGSVRVRIRAMRLACAEVARRVPDRRLGTALIETRITRSGDELHVDVDVEVPVDVCSRRGTGD